MANVAKGLRVTKNTLFELGSVSKTFTGIAGEYAVQTNILNLNDPVAVYSRELTGKQWLNIKMLNLATYTAGGLPLQLPDSVTDRKSLWQYYQQWHPQWTPGTMRNYSNHAKFLQACCIATHLFFEPYFYPKFFKQCMEVDSLSRIWISNQSLKR